MSCRQKTVAKPLCGVRLQADEGHQCARLQAEAAKGGGGPVPPGTDIEEAVRKTEVTIKDDEGKETTLTVQEAIQLMYAEQKAMLKELLTGYVKDSDSDGEPDDGAIYLEPVKKH